jgi:integrase
LDLDAGTVAITQTFSRGRLGPPKTASSTREPCFLHPVSEGAEAWTPWRRYWHREGPRPGPTAEGAALLHRLKVLKLASAGPYVFGGAGPAGRVEGPWRKTVRAAGVRYRCPETLRHTCASLLLSVGAPLLYVQRVGGWASAKVLLDNYATYIPEESGGRLTAPPVRPEPGVETVVESVTQ